VPWELAWTTLLAATTAVSMWSYKCSSTAPLCRNGSGAWLFLMSLRCIQLTHTLLSVCLPVYLTEPVFAVKQTCSPLQADLLTWMTLRSVSSAALCCMLLSCSVQSSAAPTLGAFVSFSLFCIQAVAAIPSQTCFCPQLPVSCTFVRANRLSLC